MPIEMKANAQIGLDDAVLIKGESKNGPPILLFLSQGAAAGAGIVTCDCKTARKHTNANQIAVISNQ
jgi:hypothetical protein